MSTKTSMKISSRKILLLLIITFTQITLATTDSQIDKIKTLHQDGSISNADVVRYIQQSDIKQSFDDKGYIEIPNIMIGEVQYQKLYKTFDEFIDLIENNAYVHTTLTTAEKNFGKTEGAKAYADAESGYHNCNKREHKLDKKIYFHYSRAYHKFIASDYAYLLTQYPVINRLFNQFEEIDNASREMLSQSINALEETNPYLKDALYGKNPDLTLTVKVTRYDTNNEFSTNVHHDRTGLTLILDNDDQPDNNFIIAPYATNFDFANLAPVEKMFDKQQKTSSALLFPGACLLRLGLNFYPTPHAVRPTTNEHRHSVIAFALVPGMFTNEMKTTVIDRKLINIHEL